LHPLPFRLYTFDFTDNTGFDYSRSKYHFWHTGLPGREVKPVRNLRPASDYFFALHLGHFAQSVLASAQHCMPHELLAAASALQQVDDLQPASSKPVTQTTIEKHRTSFILVLFLC